MNEESDSEDEEEEQEIEIDEDDDEGVDGTESDLRIYQNEFVQ